MSVTTEAPNLALGKPVHIAPNSGWGGTSNDVAVDGDRSNAQSNCLMTRAKKPWIIIDLEKRYVIADLALTQLQQPSRHQL